MCDNITDCTDASDENHCPYSAHQDILSPIVTSPLITISGLDCHDIVQKMPHLMNDLVPDCNDEQDEYMFLEYLSGNTTRNIVSAGCKEHYSSPCYPGYYRLCYKRYEICKHTEDEHGKIYPCRNGAHLQFCKEHKCPTFFKCPQTYCIENNQVCDGIIQCPNGEDEHNCQYGALRSCPNLYRCKNSPACIHTTQLCNGKFDCPLQDDEYVCDYQPCPDECVCAGRAYDCSYGKHNTVPVVGKFCVVLLLSHTTLQNLFFETCRYLLKLDVSSNKIKYLPESVFISCQNMMYLNLSFNDISSIKKMSFYGLINLYELHLDGNPLINIEADGFYGLISLPVLRLSSLQWMASCALFHLKSLEYIDIINSNIEVMDDEFFCDLPKLKVASFYNNNIDYITGQPFSALHHLVQLNTDDEHLCCSLPSSVKCSNTIHDEGQTCGHILPHQALHIIIWMCGLTMLVSNILSLLFWIHHTHKKSWLILIIGLTVSDLFMAVYLLLLVITDLYYNTTYSSWSADAWQTSWVCGLAMFVAQMSYQMDLWMSVLISIDRLFLTKFAIHHYKLNARSAGTGLVLGVVIICILSLINIYLSLRRDEGAPMLCLFVTTGQSVQNVQWIMFGYSLILLLTLTIINIVVGVFFIRREVINKQTSRNSNKNKMLFQLILITGNHLLCGLLLSVIQGRGLINDLETDSYVILQLIAFIVNGIMSPVINTFCKTRFRQLIISYLKRDM